ncbi:UDP-N-acetylmuramoyl-L-alanyl-D-glutamate--2,6-diaminopimelate ligase [Miltoncostaea marina]|uniref:UDP-N-acetylmuramoyl-L-alanyl-D-glutamate--2, 6-diaminopimelate ligase n=1 Tax=Miltoncostaea marina TaxID=2843215 RepID=UPI001C3D30F7|nr:UDP-N-acetylmuramoyl-L-alanyl-D-glutamate--2,6-diaminopimelate ligase [Miltoncostaea marina]
MTLEDLIREVPGARPAATPSGAPAPGAVAIASVVHRADAAGPGALFCAIPGIRADGHDFAADAVARGAAALLVERPLDLPVPQVVVPDARLGAALAASAVHGHPSRDLQVVGVTGTNGKTTCAVLLRAVLEASGRPCGLVGTIEVRVGGDAVPAAHTTPDPIALQGLFARMRAAGDRACAMEVSSHALDQRRVAGTRFAAALFTNLTRDHLDYHPDVESYYLAKRALFARPEGEGDDPPGAANLDDPYGARLARETGALGYAADSPADVRPERVTGLDSGIRARIATPRGPVEIASRLRGRFNLANLTGVVAVGELLGLPHEAVAAGIAAVAGVPGRFEAVEGGQPFPVIVDYAHTPDSLDNVLRAARDLVGGGRLIAVFGCGGDRDRGKRPQMGEVARRLADVVVVTSDNPRSEDPDAIIAEILAGARGAADLVVEPDRRAAIAAAIGRAGRGDVVVVAGKGHEQGQERDGVVTPFDDRRVAREILEGSGAAA